VKNIEKNQDSDEANARSRCAHTSIKMFVK
jgi:hypothetical protein